MTKQLHSVLFTPYIGEKYEQGYQGKKVLVLGESHYSADAEGNASLDDPTFTNYIVQEFKNYQKGEREHANWMRTFTKFAKVFHNGELSADEIVDFWERVVFYNYVQEPMAGPRQSPTTEQFAKSEKAFWEVLETYQPDIIVVWSHRLWINMPYTGEYRSKENTLINKGKGFYYYKVGNKEIAAMYISHPSATNFHYQTVYNELKEAFNL
ncbi:hypothetical protein RCZ04_11450 [Capnocytophaga sp. HP1101]